MLYGKSSLKTYTHQKYVICAKICSLEWIECVGSEYDIIMNQIDGNTYTKNFPYHIFLTCQECVRIADCSSNFCASIELA